MQCKLNILKMLVLFPKRIPAELVKTLLLPEANPKPSAPLHSGAKSITARSFGLKRSENDFSF